MRLLWQERRENPELMAAVSAGMSRGQEERFRDPAVRAAIVSDQLHTPEARLKAVASRKLSSRGYSDNPVGYKDLHMQQEHPLARKGGLLGEHRKVLYEKIGPGPHLCHWGCGKLLEWGGLSGIVADHLDDDKLNNDPDNLVPSCSPCNCRRG